MYNCLGQEEIKMTTMNKKALVDVIAEKNGMTKKEANDTLELILTTISEALKDGNKVDLAGFGKFETKERKARTGINPATKEKITIAASKSVGFKSSKLITSTIADSLVS